MNRILAAIAGSIFVASTAWGQPRPATVWGPTTDGLQLGVSAVASGTEGAYVVEVTFRNTGSNDDTNGLPMVGPIAPWPPSCAEMIVLFSAPDHEP